MANRCEICGKSTSFGHNVSHSKRRTNRKWRPNIQRTRVVIGGAAKQIDICTRCLRSMHAVG